MLADAISHYHDLLTPTLAADAQAHLDHQTRSRGMLFGTRPVCSVLRPRFLSPDQYRFLCGAVRRIAGAFSKIYQAGIADADFRKQFRMTPAEETLISYDPGFTDPSPTSRLDSFFVSENELKFTEYNSETPAGAGYNDVLTDMFWGSPALAAFRRKYQVRPLPSRPHVLDALMGSFAQWQGNTSTPPRIAIVDWSDVPTQSEFLIFQRFFHENGLECRIVEPREIEYDGKTLRAGDYAFNLIYKRVLISELVDRDGLDHPIIRAVRDGKCCFVNGFRCKLLFKKASFAVLSDERNARLLSGDEQSAVDAFIPWTRVLEERKTQFHGKAIDLVPFAMENKDRLVLKPNDDYGGHGITLGWTADAATWEAAVKHALTTPYVVQEKVSLPREVFPGFENGKLMFLDRMLDTNPFVLFSSEMDACLTRISTEALLNVTAGGGSTVPTVVVEPR
ncbi:MAG: hypothetical protein K1X57_12330 [Gemmataceae bacterium]|nr:hypothetical protein [Gemmataceae bacterium]